VIRAWRAPLVLLIASNAMASSQAQWEPISPTEVERIILDRRIKHLVPPASNVNIPAFKRFLELPLDQRFRIIQGYVRYKDSSEDVRARAVENARKFKTLTRTEKLNLQERWKKWKAKE
jgi:hypothetical protein